MPMADPIADFLSRLRNGIMARQKDVSAPSSTLKVRLADVFKQEGYISGYSVKTDEKGFDQLVVRLRWNDARSNAITGMRRRSRPGQRVYIKSQAIPKVRSGLGIGILSTSRGLLTDRDARKAGVGGELICEVW